MCYFWGKTEVVHWDAITRIKVLKLPLLKYVVMYYTDRKGKKKSIWISLLIKDLAGFRREVEAKAPDGSLIKENLKSLEYRSSVPGKVVSVLFYSTLTAFFVAGWIVTYPRPNYRAYSYGADSGKLVLIEDYDSYIPALVVAEVWKFYSHLHWKRSVKSWAYDMKSGVLTEKNWEIETEDLSPFSSSNRPIFLPAKNRFAVTRSFEDGRRVRLRVLAEGGAVEFEYFIKERSFWLKGSPGGTKIISPEGHNGCEIIDIEKKNVIDLEKIESVVSYNCLLTRWVNDDEFIVRIASDKYRGSEDWEQGLYTFDIENGISTLVVKDGGHPSAISNDGESVVFTTKGEDKSIENMNVVRYSIADGTLLQEFEARGDHSTVASLLSDDLVVLYDLDVEEDADYDELPDLVSKYPLLYIGALLNEANDDIYWAHDPVFFHTIDVYDWDGNLENTFKFSHIFMNNMDFETVDDATMVLPYSYRRKEYSLNFFNQTGYDAILLNVRTGEQQKVSELLKSLGVD